MKRNTHFFLLVLLDAKISLVVLVTGNLRFVVMGLEALVRIAAGASVAAGDGRIAR